MAVAYASSNNSGWVDGGLSANCVVTKPSGLAVGDILLLHFQRESPALDSDFSGQGFTVLQTQNQNTAGAQMSNYVGWKVADSADVAASTFTFSSGGTSNTHAAALFRITGAAPSGITSSSGVTANSTSVSVTGITQPTADNLLMFLVSGTDDTSTVSAYAVATSNPTWTEIHDFSTTLGDDHFMSAAWGSRSPATSTGNATCTVSGATSDTFVALVSFRPLETVSVSETSTLSDTLLAIRSRFVTVTESLALTEVVSAVVSKWKALTKTAASTWTAITKND